MHDVGPDDSVRSVWDRPRDQQPVISSVNWTDSRCRDGGRDSFVGGHIDYRAVGTSCGVSCSHLVLVSVRQASQTLKLQLATYPSLSVNTRRALSGGTTAPADGTVHGGPLTLGPKRTA